MPPKAVRGMCQNMADKYRNQKSKAQETEDLVVQEDSIQYQIRERRESKSKKDVSPCTSNTQERLKKCQKFSFSLIYLELLQIQF